MNSTPRDYYVLRRPLFSVDRLKRLNLCIEERNLKSIKEIFGDPTFLTSIYLSSREFYFSANNWLQTTSTFSHSDKIFLSLYKYYVRITTRATPYGFFAGFSTGKVSHDKSEIRFSPNCAKVNMRIDTEFFEHLKAKILVGEGSNEIPFKINNTLYKFDDGKVRFIERDENFDYKIAEISSNEVLEILISNQHEMSKRELVEHIRTHFGSLEHEEEVEVSEYIDNLIDNQVLIANIPPYLTNPIDAGIQFITALHSHGISNLELDEILQYVEKVNVENRLDVSEIEVLFNKHEQKSHQLFQVDLAFQTLLNNLKHRSLKRIIQQAIELSNLSTVRSSPEIQRFKEEFLRKYELRRIPLLEVIDPEKGIGYGQQISGNIEEMPLLNDIVFSYAVEAVTKVPKIISLIIERYGSCLEKFSEISLSEEDVASCSDDLHHSIIGDNYILGKLAASSFEDFDEGNFKFLLMNAAPTAFAGKILSRFSCHDSQLHEKNIQHVEKGDAEFAIAEVVHLPSLRQGNILLRPSFYEYEIPIYSLGNPNKTEIKISDICVSVEAGAVKLWSMSLDKEIKPRLSSAYNHPQAQLPLFKLLCDLQYEGVNEGFRWNWSVLSGSKYLPRVSYKNIILASAKWRFKVGKRSSLSVLKEELKENNVPRYCEIREWDNVLLMDIENEICLSIIKIRLDKTDLDLHEAISELYIRDQDQNVAFEMVLPFQVNGVAEAISHRSRLELPFKEKVKRIFPPGSDWLYVKFYCNHNTQDKVIREIIYPLLIERKDLNESIKQWFFIRYNDPLPHIRLRINSRDLAGLTMQINHLAEALINSDLISSIQLDTYVRELERYGQDNIESSEKLFYLDSIAVSRYIISLEKEEWQKEDEIWKAAILSVHQLLNDFQISLEDRVSLFNMSHHNFRKEFVDVNRKEKVKEFKFSIDRKYRKHKDDIFKLLTKNKDELDENMRYFFERSDSELISAIANNFSGKVPLDIVASYIHMSINRLFNAKQRMNEMVIYYFLYKSYDSLKNR